MLSSEEWLHVHCYLRIATTDSPKSRKGQRVKILGLVAALIGIVGGLLGILAYFKDPGTPDENQAQLFLESYYATAQQDPSDSWAMTTDSYRDQKLVRSFEAYADYWQSFQGVEVDEVGLSKDPQRPGWWKARVTFTDRTGKVTRPDFQYQLGCTWESNLPWNDCERGYVLLNKVRQYKPADFMK